MRRILQLCAALAICALSLGSGAIAWADPGSGNDAGQANGHGRGLQTAPGQTGEKRDQGSSNGASNGNTSSGDNGRAEPQGNSTTAGSTDNSNGITGNSGTIKVSSVPLASATMANDSQPGCAFYVLGFGFPTGSGTYSITPQPANGNGPAGSTTSRESPIAYSSGVSSPYSVLVQNTSRPNDKGYDFQIGPITDFTSGQYKVSVDSSGTPGGAKHKVFRLDCPNASTSSVTQSSEGPAAQTPETVHVQKTADTDTIGSDQLNGKPFTFNILIMRNGSMPSATIRAVDDLRSYCPSVLSIDEVTSDNVGFTSSIENCTVTIVGDAKANVGNMVHLKVHLLPQASTQSLPSNITNSVSVQVAGAGEASTASASAQVTIPVQAPLAVAGVQAQTDTATVAVAPTVTESADNATAAEATALSAPVAPEVKGVAQTPLEVAGVQVGASVTVPAGVPVEENGDTVSVTGPAVVMVGSQPAEVPAGEILVLGVQAAQAAPNTGTAGLVATEYVYSVQPGDTLQSIAASYYGDSGDAWSIYQANASVLGDSMALAPGTVLVLP